MADQNFMDLASKTASGITGTDYMMLVNNSEAYKALVNDVAEAILGKLTSKSFSGLETTAKNVIGALNELNSKSGQYVTSKQAFLNAVKKYTNASTAIWMPGTVLSEITNSKYSSSAKGIAAYDGSNIDFIFTHGDGNVIITGRMNSAGTLISLYRYTGTSALDN